MAEVRGCEGVRRDFDYDETTFPIIRSTHSVEDRAMPVAFSLCLQVNHFTSLERATIRVDSSDCDVHYCVDQKGRENSNVEADEICAMNTPYTCHVCTLHPPSCDAVHKQHVMP